MSTREIRAHPTEVRAARTEGGGLRFSGYAAKFNTWSQDLGGFKEQIAPGAFTEAIGRDDVRVLVNHDPNRVLGRTKSGTARLTEDEIGLRFEVEAPDAGWARDFQMSVERGDVDQCSFMFEREADEWHWGDPNRDELDERTLKKVKLFDVSIVTFPAYLDTEASARGAQEAREAASAERETARAAAAAQKRRRLRRKLEFVEKTM